jgi:hypothetical protein
MKTVKKFTCICNGEVNGKNHSDINKLTSCTLEVKVFTARIIFRAKSFIK